MNAFLEPKHCRIAVLVAAGCFVILTADAFAPEYNPCGWRAWLNNTSIFLGMQNVLDSDPPFVAGSFENGYDESLTTIKGRFWYVQLKKRF